MALEPGEGRNAVPVRSALLGSVLAVALIVTALTFGNSLQTLVSRPALYGWNWTYILQPVGAGNGNVPKVAISLLKHDRYVAAYSGASYNDAEIDGQGVPFLVEDIGASVAPPILSGHGVDAPREVVLGAATMASLHKHLGQYVTVSYGSSADAPIWVPPTRLQIVGTATFPAIGFASTVSDHTSMGTGGCSRSRCSPRPSERHQRRLGARPRRAEPGARADPARGAAGGGDRQLAAHRVRIRQGLRRSRRRFGR